MLNRRHDPSTVNCPPILLAKPSSCLKGVMCGRLSLGKGFFDVLLQLGRCGHVCGLLMRHTWAAGHNAFRRAGSRSKARARSALTQVGSPALGIDRQMHYIAVALPNS